jgi:hypothetical protein
MKSLVKILNKVTDFIQGDTFCAIVLYTPLAFVAFLTIALMFAA